jgi:hypothetical protein
MGRLLKIPEYDTEETDRYINPEHIEYVEFDKEGVLTDDVPLLGIRMISGENISLYCMDGVTVEMVEEFLIELNAR